MNVAGQRFVLDMHKINRGEAVIFSSHLPHLSQMELPTISDGTDSSCCNGDVLPHDFRNNNCAAYRPDNTGGAT